MPYLDYSRKQALDQGVVNPATPGDLTYLLTRTVLQGATLQQLEAVIDSYLPEEPRFADFAIVLGSLDATSREYVRRTGRTLPATLAILPHLFYRERIAPYEDEKIEQNGDVYP